MTKERPDPIGARSHGMASRPRRQVLILDVDGTLLDDEKRMSPDTAAEIRRAVRTGVHVVLASGRMYGAIRQWVREFGLRSPQICNNGAEVVIPQTEERLQHLVIPPHIVRRLYRFGKEHGITTVVYAGDRVLATRHSPDDHLIERNGEFVEVVSEAELLAPSLKAEKVLFLDIRRPERLLEVRDLLDPGDACTATVSEPGILNFCHPRAAKHRALEVVCRCLGARPEVCAAVGDGENDAELLAAVGFGIAMGNAAECTRKAAAAVVADNNHGGAAEAIRMVLEGGGLTDGG